jgi:hypothetical protein
MHGLKIKWLARWIAGALAVCMVLVPFCSACCWVSVQVALNSAGAEEASCHHGSHSGSFAWNHFAAMPHCASADAAVEPVRWDDSSSSSSRSSLRSLPHSLISRATIISALQGKEYFPWPADQSPHTPTISVQMTHLRV